jgi:hypothetical protein
MIFFYVVQIILSEKVYQMKQPVKVLHLAGEYLVSSSADCKIRTWAIDDMSGEITLKATLKGHVGPPTRLKTDGDVLFSLSSRDETLRTWSLSVRGCHWFECEFIVLGRWAAIDSFGTGSTNLRPKQVSYVRRFKMAFWCRNPSFSKSSKDMRSTSQIWLSPERMESFTLLRLTVKSLAGTGRCVRRPVKLTIRGQQTSLLRGASHVSKKKQFSHFLPFSSN